MFFVLKKKNTGLEETAEPCCEIGKDGSGLCVPGMTACEKRNTTLFWDQAHISQAGSEIIAMKVFNGSGFTTPANIVDAIKLGGKPTTSQPPATSAAHSGTSFNLLLVLAFSVVLSLF